MATEGYLVALAAFIALILGSLTGCSGWALIPVPEPGSRVSLVSEQRISNIFESGVETVAERSLNPASLPLRFRGR